MGSTQLPFHEIRLLTLENAYIGLGESYVTGLKQKKLDKCMTDGTTTLIHNDFVKHREQMLMPDCMQSQIADP